MALSMSCGLVKGSFAMNAVMKQSSSLSKNALMGSIGFHSVLNAVLFASFSAGVRRPYKLHRAAMMSRGF